MNKDKEILQICPERRMIPVLELKATNKEHFALKVFDPIVISFFDALSKKIITDSNLNRLGVTAALGFWLRKSHITNIINENQYLVQSSKVVASPAGLVFHVCPSNVDTMFLYSLAISLLSGNKNILRISERLSDPIIDVIFDLINSTLEISEYIVLQDYINIVRYGHDADINNHFSAIADIRIIWGGDATINLFKTFNTGSRTRDISFADRISCSVFKTESFLSASQDLKNEITRKFFNDSYTFDQLGCSSPQFIFLLGNEQHNKEFELEFYNLLDLFAETNYNNDISSIASLKLNKLVDDSLNDNELVSSIRTSNYLYFVNMSSANQALIHSCGAGYFYTQPVTELAEIHSLINKKIQTLSYYGLTDMELHLLTQLSAGSGIDRIVPIGSALDFEYIWDGINLFESLTTKKWVIGNR